MNDAYHLLPSAAWLGVLQAFVSPSATGFGFETVARPRRLASVLGLTVMIYRLAWRQEMENTKSNVTTGIERIERGSRRSSGGWIRSRRTHERWIREVFLALVTPLLEKNIVKTFGLDAPFVVSMSRVIVLAFAIGELRQMWRAGIAGWPEATLAIAIVLALPLLGAIERARPSDVMELARTLVSRFGVGGVRPMASVYAAAREPSKFDDHRGDE